MTFKIILLLCCFLIPTTSPAKDLFVSTTGSDSTTWADNDINSPWLTVGHAFANVQAGDNVYFRTGTYTISSTISTSGSANGTAVNPVTFSNYNDEVVNFSANFGGASEAPASAAIQIDRDYYSISGINFSAPGTFWYVANALSATHFTVSDGTCNVTQDGAGANVACVRFQTSRANYGRVENLVMQGPGSGGNINTAGILTFRSQGLKILNNDFSGFPRALYYKHTCIAADTGTEFAYNYFHDNNMAFSDVSQYSNIHDNLIVGGIYETGIDGGAGDDGSNAGSDHNNIHHNTFYNSTLSLTRSSSNDGSGAQYNNIHDNVFTSQAEVFRYVSLPHYSTMDWNLYDPTTAVINNGSNYSLSSWQSYYSQDANSIADDPIFIGGGSPSAISDYALTSSSPGYMVASNGADMGANVSLVGAGVTAPNTGNHFGPSSGGGWANAAGQVYVAP